ncbi:hypothetical protein GCM10027517_07210 [Phycicoccus ginsengisoli]
MSVEAKLKELDAAHGVPDDLGSTPHARQVLGRIMDETQLAAPPARVSPRRALKYAVAAGTVLVGGAVLVDFARGGTAYASWTPTARVASPEQQARLGWDCMSHLSGHGYRVRLVELRGRYAYTVLQGSDGYEATCLAQDPDTSPLTMVQGFEGPLAEEPPSAGLMTNSVRSMTDDNGDVAFEVTGKAGADVVSVSIVTDFGDVQSTLEDGYFAAWWPGRKSLIPSFGPPNPTVRITLKDGTTRQAPIQDFDVSPM